METTSGCVNRWTDKETVMYWKETEYATPKYDILAYGSFWTEGNQDAAGSGKPFTSLSSVQFSSSFSLTYLKEFRGPAPEKELLPELFFNIWDIILFQSRRYIPTIQMFSSLYLCLSQFGGFLFHLNSIV